MPATSKFDRPACLSEFMALIILIVRVRYRSIDSVYEKFFIIKAGGKGTGTMSSCEATCYGVSCDEYLAGGADSGGHDFESCQSMEEEYLCDCSSCWCDGEEAASTQYQYESASADFDGTTMRGLPFPGSLRKFGYCVSPGHYTMTAIDTQADGWWGGARYSVIVDGAVVLDEEMGNRSSSVQSTGFTVVLPLSARTAFSENRASQGGGGAMFWDMVPPENLNNYRNTSGSNSALYGDYVATPATSLVAANTSYKAVSGKPMTNDPITVLLHDR